MAAEVQTVVFLPFSFLSIFVYVVAALLIVGGRSNRRPPLIGWGLIVGGVMTAVLPLAYYGNEIARIGQSIPATFTDFVIVALFSLVGGLMIQFGIGYLRLPSSQGTTIGAPP